MRIFLSENHNGLIENAEITQIGKIDQSDPTRREKSWNSKLETLFSYELSI